MNWVIKHRNGTYYKCWTGIGPCFGGDIDSAMKFKTLFDAVVEQERHYAFIETSIEEIANREAGWQEENKKYTRGKKSKRQTSTQKI